MDMSAPEKSPAEAAFIDPDDPTFEEIVDQSVESSKESSLPTSMPLKTPPADVLAG